MRTCERFTVCVRILLVRNVDCGFHCAQSYGQGNKNRITLSFNGFLLSFLPKKRRLVSWLQGQHLKGLCLHANALSTLAKLDFVQYLFGQKTELKTTALLPQSSQKLTEEEIHKLLQYYRLLFLI